MTQVRRNVDWLPHRQWMFRLSNIVFSRDNSQWLSTGAFPLFSRVIGLCSIAGMPVALGTLTARPSDVSQWMTDPPHDTLMRHLMNTRQTTPADAPLSPLPVRLFRTFVVASALIAFGAAMGFCEEPTLQRQQIPPAQNGWAASWAEAVEMSKKTSKPIMLQFTGSDWCDWCQKLEANVFNQPAFSQWSDRVIKIRIDFPASYQLPERQRAQNKVLKEWYADFVTSYPTCLFVQPTGRVIGSLGYVDGGPQNWIERAEGVLLNAHDLHASLSHNRLMR